MSQVFGSVGKKFGKENRSEENEECYLEFSVWKVRDVVGGPRTRGHGREKKVKTSDRERCIRKLEYR